MENTFNGENIGAKVWIEKAEDGRERLTFCMTAGVNDKAAVGTGLEMEEVFTNCPKCGAVQMVQNGQMEFDKCNAENDEGEECGAEL